jgi:hypothetical protein
MGTARYRKTVLFGTKKGENTMSASTMTSPPPSLPGSSLRAIALFDIVLPFVTIVALSHQGVAPLRTYALASLFPAASVLIAWFGRRRFDVVGLGVLLGIASGLGLAVLTGDPRLGLVRAAPAFGLFGVACFVSLLTARPLMFFVARAFSTGGDPAANAAWNARLDEPLFRRTMRLLTAVWGVGTLFHAVAGVAVVLALPASAAAIAEPVIGIGILMALLGWTRLVRRRAAARNAG